MAARLTRCDQDVSNKSSRTVTTCSLSGQLSFSRQRAYPSIVDAMGDYEDWIAAELDAGMVSAPERATEARYRRCVATAICHGNRRSLLSSRKLCALRVAAKPIGIMKPCRLPISDVKIWNILRQSLSVSISAVLRCHGRCATILVADGRRTLPARPGPRYMWFRCAARWPGCRKPGNTASYGCCRRGGYPHIPALASLTSPLDPELAGYTPLAEQMAGRNVIMTGWSMDPRGDHFRRLAHLLRSLVPSVCKQAVARYV